MQLPLLPPKVLAVLDALHLRVPLRTAVFGTIDFYRRMKIPFIRHAISQLEKRKRNEIRTTGRKIKVCFICVDKSQWGMQSIYDAMASSKSFEPIVLVTPNWIRHGTSNPQQDTILFFKEKGMRSCTSLSESALPDIVFTPYFDSKKFGHVVDFHSLYKKSLLCIVMYGWIVTNSDKHFFGNQELAYFWKNIVFNQRELNICKQLLPTVGNNATCLGFPRGDEILSAAAEDKTWKMPTSKKIIWAPHWSVLTHSRLGNFDRYAYKLLDWLKSHKDVEIVLKPHPLLRARLTDSATIAKLSAGNPDFQNPNTFKTAEEYDAFLSEWESLPNGTVMDSGDYFSLFKSSDAMLLDSGSFMAEYMILDKPMCFCNRDRSFAELQNAFNTFGGQLLTGMAIADNWDSIESFLSSVGKEDKKKEVRQQMISQFLSANKGHVGESIATFIKSTLSNHAVATNA